MIDLMQSREQIDAIDRQIVALFEKRMAVAEQVADYKIRTGREVLDAKREQEKLFSLQEMAHGSFNTLGVRELFQQIMSMSRKKQYQLLTEHGVEEERSYEMVDALQREGVTVVFQGVEGAYSYEAMRAFFPGKIQSFHVKTWKDAMEAITEGRADYAVLPIENSTAGIVSDIYDLLTQYRQAFLVGEQIIRVEHVLAGLPGTSLSGIRRVYSHPQALAQCREFLEGYPAWEQYPMENTAVAAKRVMEEQDPSCAAVSSRLAAQVHGLEVLKENISSNEGNATRFVIVGGIPRYERTAGKVSICFELPHESGSLYNMLSHVIYNGLNMTKIESRPIPGKNWEYRFFVDFDGNLEDPAVKNALRGIRQEANALRVFGNFS